MFLCQGFSISIKLLNQNLHFLKDKKNHRVDQRFLINVFSNYLYFLLNQYMKQQEQLNRDSKVQFFQSQSSFGTQSVLSNSRLNDFTDDIFSNTNSIFIILKKYLSNTPLQKNIDTDYLTTLYNRARILSKEAIPQQIQLMTRVGSGSKQFSIINQCSEKLNRFISDFQEYQTGNLEYKEIYNKYCGNQNEQSRIRSSSPFSKKSVVFNQQSQILPQIIEIVDKKHFQLSGGANYYNLKQSRQANKQQIDKKDQQIIKLKEYIRKLKRGQKQKARFMEIMRNNKNKQTESTIKSLLALRWTQTNIQPNQELIFNQKLLAKYQEDLKAQSNKNLQLNQAINQLSQTFAHLKEKNQILQNNNLKRLTNKQLSEQIDLSTQPIKMEKKIKDLFAQKNVLKKEINLQRQLNYASKLDRQQSYLNQISRLQRTLQNIKQQQSNLTQQYDRIKIENIRLKQSGNFSDKILLNLKNENNNLQNNKGIMKQIGISKNLQVVLKNEMISKNKAYVSSYEGEGVEGYPYYELLNKQFKIRYRRSCLKDKQLLYRSHGLQIGVISQFSPPNEIKLLLHFTNYSDGILKNIKIRLMNPNDNKFSIDRHNIQILKLGEQIKVSLLFSIINYPIGPTILLCQLINQQKVQQLRVLLPVHIFKMMLYQSRNQEMKHPQTIQLKSTDRKISKDILTLKSYFGTQKQKHQINNNLIKISAFHEHTNTRTFLEIKFKDQDLNLIYENITGEVKISQYFIKTLAFLLSK